MKDLFDLTGKVALVTGGSRGLGREMALAFAEHGADLVIVSRTADRCENVAAEVRDRGRRAMVVAADIGRWSEVDRVVDTTYAEFGRVDVLVNNAGVAPLTAVSAETDEATFDEILAVNYKGAFRLAVSIGERMAAGDGGSIINVSSVGALSPGPGFVPYAGAKAALNTLAPALSQEFGPAVRVNTLSPGPFFTDLAEFWPAGWTPRNTVGRAGQPHEIVAAALYLASSASSYTSGSLVRVDGGLY